MIEQPPHIPADLAKAFATAVRAYKKWLPEHEGHQIIVRDRFYRLVEICGLVDQFNDALPDNILKQLRSYMHDVSHGRLIVALDAQPTYKVGAFCLRKMMEGRIEAATRH